METSYKEKYEQALAKAKEQYNYPCMRSCMGILEEIFPELKESEDEKIRKALKQYFVNSFQNNGVAAICGVHVKDVFAWLEKQGQVKESHISQHENRTCEENGNSLTSEGERIRKEIINYFQCQSEEEPTRKEIHDKWIAWLENIPVTIDHEKREGFHLGYREALDYAGGFCVLKKNEQRMVSAEESLGIDSDTYNKIVDECIFGEQKPKENKGNVGGISANSERCEENEPHKELAESYLAKFDEKFPILPTLKGKQLADYKNFLNKCQQIFGLKYWGIHPTQAKLFEKLSLLWATWGAEHLQGLGQTYGDMDDEILWSEEDEQRLNSCLNILQPKTFVGNTETINTKWLKSLKDRVQPQPKQEWSAEDKYMYDILCGTIESTDINENTKYKLITWLKSLRPQKYLIPSEEEIEKAAQEWDSKANFNPFYMTMENGKPTGVQQSITTHKESFKAGINWILKFLKGKVKPHWKPNDEQMAILWNYADQNDYDGAVLTSLYNDLKKLKEE